MFLAISNNECVCEGTEGVFFSTQYETTSSFTYMMVFIQFFFLIVLCSFFSLVYFSYLEFLQSLEEKVDQDWAGISSSLEEIRKSLLSRNGCLVNLTADGKILTNSEKFVSRFLDSLPSNSLAETTNWNARLPLLNEAIVIPTQVRISICSSCLFAMSRSSYSM